LIIPQYISMLYLVATEGVPPPKKKKKGYQIGLKGSKNENQRNQKEDNSSPNLTK